jgi:peroxiredoxin
MKDNVGSPAVAFTLEDTAGTVRSLDQFLGHWLLMVFHRHLG